MVLAVALVLAAAVIVIGSVLGALAEILDMEDSEQ